MYALVSFAMMSREHASDDRLEEYCLGRVPAGELDDLDDHLLVCPQCLERLRETEIYVGTMRQAVTAAAREAPARRGAVPRWFATLLRPAPAAAFCGVAALVLVWGIAPSMRGRRMAEPVAITLEATRGGGESLRANAPERTPLALTLDLTGVPPLAAYNVRIVDANGAPVFDASTQPAGGRLMVSAPPRLVRGTYWVRLYDRDAPPALLREYGLELR
jgi:hypothetical protein